MTELSVVVNSHACVLATIFFMLLDILKVCEERQELGIKKQFLRFVPVVIYL